MGQPGLAQQILSRCIGVRGLQLQELQRTEACPGPKRTKIQHCARVAQRWFVIDSLPLATLVDEVRPMVIGVNTCPSLKRANLRIDMLLDPQVLGSN